jgi:hypothetical protein
LLFIACVRGLFFGCLARSQTFAFSSATWQPQFMQAVSFFSANRIACKVTIQRKIWSAFCANFFDFGGLILPAVVCDGFHLQVRFMPCERRHMILGASASLASRRVFKSCRLTKRAPDDRESAAFSSIILASSFSCSRSESRPTLPPVTQTVRRFAEKILGYQ